MWTLLVASALAHTALEYPPPRYPSDGSTANKACPCGVGQSNRLCNVASDRSDPDRNDARASTFEPGETITVVYHETIGHAGRIRIAFDDDGADMADFNEHILLDVEDPPGAEGNVGQGSRWELEVTLPDTPCDNCTLQLVQMMDGNTDDPVPDPIGRSSYYQCADLVLGKAPKTTPTGDTGTTSTDDTTPTADTGEDPTDGLQVEDGVIGCGCDTSTPGGLVGLGLVLLGMVRFRRRRSD